MAARFRPRPIDFDKPLPVVRSQNELEVNDDGTLVPKKDLLTESIEDVDEVDAETLRIIQEQYDKEAKKANIPVPPILTIDDYDKHVPKDYVRPQSYLRFKPLTEKEQDEKVEYEMDEPDMEFTHTIALKEEKFEAIIDRLEKESFKQGKMCEFGVLEPYKFANSKLMTQVYDYWRKKREKLGKALIRRFQPPTSIHDTSPHSTFRPREKEEKRMRRTRMKDKDAHKNLKQFHADFKRAKELLENLVKREKAKKALLQLDFCLQFAKDIKDIPAAVLKQHEEFFKDWHRDRDKTKQGSNKKAPPAEAADDEAAAGAGTHRPRAAAGPRPAAAVEAEPEAPPPEDGGDGAKRYEGMRRCWQRLMRNWTGDKGCPGTSLLPISADGKLVAVPATQEMHLRLHGRARIGRGGRLLFDICSRRTKLPSVPDSHQSDDPDWEWSGSAASSAAAAVVAAATAATAAETELLRAKRKREAWEAVRSAAGPDARKAVPALISSVWEEMRAEDREATSGAMRGGRHRGHACWNFGTVAKSSYLD